jgi:dipeptidyl aminopeptidase/acylaminoacyl peptidase
MVSRTDGSGLVDLTPAPLSGPTFLSFSPDGRLVTGIAVVDFKPQILVVPSDGSAPPRFFDVGITTDDAPPQFNADGSEIVFVGRRDGAGFRGVHAMDVSTGAVRTIAEGTPGADVHGAELSPDGSRIAYGTFDTTSSVVSAVIHVVGIDGTGAVELGLAPDVLAAAGTTWSNDGMRLIVVEFLIPDGTRARSAIIPVGGPAPHLVLECRPGGSAAEDCSGNWERWSPDDRLLIGTAIDGSPHLLVDTVTGAIRTAPWTGTGAGFSWQRLAP